MFRPGKRRGAPSIIDGHQRHQLEYARCLGELRQLTTSEDELVGRFASLRTIGVDYGLTRTGVAVTTGGYRPRPLAILSGLNTTELVTSLVDYVQSEQAANIVLGLPLNKNGTVSQQSLVTRDFGQALLSEVRSRCGPGIPIQLWDERYTSKEAASRITAEAMARNEVWMPVAHFRYARRLDSPS